MSGWWSALGFGKSVAPAEDDFADMGTAFGLDASMDTVPSACLPPASGHPEAQARLVPFERTGRPSR